MTPTNEDEDDGIVAEDTTSTTAAVARLATIRVPGGRHLKRAEVSKRLAARWSINANTNMQIPEDNEDEDEDQGEEDDADNADNANTNSHNINTRRKTPYPRKNLMRVVSLQSESGSESSQDNNGNSHTHGFVSTRPFRSVRPFSTLVRSALRHLSARLLRLTDIRFLASVLSSTQRHPRSGATAFFSWCQPRDRVLLRGAAGGDQWRHPRFREGP